MNLNVVYSSDNNYAQHVGVSMISLFENNKDFNNINIYLIENNISLQNKNRLESICEKYNRKIKFISFDEFSKKLKLNMEITQFLLVHMLDYFYLAHIEESIDKIIYLDCDSIINGSLSDLWNTDISEYYVAGVCDTVSDNTKIRINMDLYSSYINSGMLLINLKKWREESIEKKFIEFINLYTGKYFIMIKEL